MTSALDEFIKTIELMSCAFNNEDEIKTQNVEMRTEIQSFKADIAGRFGHPGTGVVMSCFVFILSISAFIIECFANKVRSLSRDHHGIT